MNKVLMDLLQEWRASQTQKELSLHFPAPEHARGFYPYGFVRKNDSAADFVDWYGLSLTLRRTDRGGDGDAVRVTAFFADQEPLEVTPRFCSRRERHI